MTKEEKLKGLLLNMFDIAKLSDSIEGFNKLNKENDKFYIIILFLLNKK